MFRFLWITFIIITFVYAKVCPNGGTIYRRGVDKKTSNIIVNAHNKFRLDIANGKVQNQPKGINLKRMSYDSVLAKGAESVSNTCKFSHKVIPDIRFPFVGQNIFIQSSSEKIITPDWNTAISSWFGEHKRFHYPNKSTGVTGHYTQIVWADTYKVGCDFIAYYDSSKKGTPHVRLYTCNYGPGGNIRGRAPYLTGKSGCKNLC